MSARAVFVAGAHTEIGKTFVAAALLKAARANGRLVDVLKPVVSDFDEADWAESDPGRLLAAAGTPLTQAALSRTSPWRFRAPLAPPAAARQDGRALPFPAICDFTRDRIQASAADLMLVEGVGGLMSPIADSATSLDLLMAAGGENILVVGSYLGAISHGLTALEVLRANGQAPLAIVASDRGATDDPAFDGTLSLLREHVQEIPLFAARHGRTQWIAALLEVVSRQRRGAKAMGECR